MTTRTPRLSTTRTARRRTASPTRNFLERRPWRSHPSAAAPGTSVVGSQAIVLGVRADPEPGDRVALHETQCGRPEGPTCAPAQAKSPSGDAGLGCRPPERIPAPTGRHNRAEAPRFVSPFQGLRIPWKPVTQGFAAAPLRPGLAQVALSGLRSTPGRRDSARARHSPMPSRAGRGRLAPPTAMPNSATSSLAAICVALSGLVHRLGNRHPGLRGYAAAPWAGAGRPFRAAVHTRHRSGMYLHTTQAHVFNDAAVT